MDGAQIAKYSKLIQGELTKLKEEIQTIQEKIKPVAPDRAIGRLSRLEAINDKSIQEATVRKMQLRVAKLEAALSRVQTKNYGFCLRCEEPIEEKRLQILPETTLCMECLDQPEE